MQFYRSNVPIWVQRLCLVPAGGSSSGSGESADPAAAPSSGGDDEQNNGPRKKPKDSSKKEECTTPQPSQGAPTNELTHPAAAVTEECKPERNAEESRSDSGEASTETRTADAEAEDGGRTREGEGEKSSAPNNFDFDLSSDSDNDSATDKPPSSESESEGRREEAETAANQNDAKDPLEVLLPDPELGNGCPDKREPETESQNSEQSGVTTGEELLDQSMEDDEDEEEEDVDHDDHLIYLEEVLERIHAEYYSRYQAYLSNEAQDSPDIRRIVPELKGKTLEGTRIVFSGLYPTNYPMERTREFYHAKALGAKVGKGLLLGPKDPGRTTHLIAARAGRSRCGLMRFNKLNGPNIDILPRTF